MHTISTFLGPVLLTYECILRVWQVITYGVLCGFNGENFDSDMAVEKIVYMYIVFMHFPVIGAVKAEGHKPASQRAQNVMMTSLFRQNDVVTSFWRNNYVIIHVCSTVYWVFIRHVACWEPWAM